MSEGLTNSRSEVESHRRGPEAGWIGALVLGGLLGFLAGAHLNSETSPADELNQWVEAGFSKEESRILVTYGRAKLVPSDIRRLAQAGSPEEAEASAPSAAAPTTPPRRAAQAAAAAPPRPPRQTRPPAAAPETRRRLGQSCRDLQAGQFTTPAQWFQAMQSQGNPWNALAARVQNEVPPEQQMAAVTDAWKRLCTAPAQH